MLFRTGLSLNMLLLSVFCEQSNWRHNFFLAQDNEYNNDETSECLEEQLHLIFILTAAFELMDGCHFPSSPAVTLGLVQCGQISAH